MDIGFVYSRKDPKQAQARDFLVAYLKQRGILARVVETDSNVNSPRVIINGHEIKDLRTKPRGTTPKMYPAIKDIAAAVDRFLWTL